MAQNKGESKAAEEKADKPVAGQEQEQQETQKQTQEKAKEQNSEAQESKEDAAQALAKLEADLKAEQDKKSTKPDTSTVSKKKANPTPTANTQVVKSRSWLAVFAFLLSLGAIAAAGFVWWQNQLWLQNQEQLNQIKQQSLLNTQQSLNQQQAQITDLLSKLSQQQNTQQSTQQSIDLMQNRVKELGESQPNYWLAAEANYLINLAERRLLVEQDVNTAIQLLVDASQRLAAMQDPSVFHIRTAVSEDIAALRVVKQPNTDDIYLTLSGLLNQVKTLPFDQAHIPDLKQESEQTVEVSDNIDDWQHNLAVSAKRFFAHFITVRKQGTQVQPQLPADQQWYVRSNLTTQLLMAQNAVLDKNQQRYIDAINTISLWSQEYFDTKEPSVVAFVNGIEHLSKQNVELVLPSGLATQPLIANFVIEQLKLKEENND